MTDNEVKEKILQVLYLSSPNPKTEWFLHEYFFKNCPTEQVTRCIGELFVQGKLRKNAEEMTYPYVGSVAYYVTHLAGDINPSETVQSEFKQAQPTYQAASERIDKEVTIKFWAGGIAIVIVGIILALLIR